MVRRWAFSATLFFLMPAGALPIGDPPQVSDGRIDETLGNKSDFVPGNRVIFFDDFSKTEVGDFPKQWTLKGPGGGGNALSVVSRNGAKFLFSETPPEGTPQTSSTVYVRLPKLSDLAEIFTVEFDAIFGRSRLATDLQAEKQYDIRVGSSASSYSLLAVSSEQAVSRNTQSRLTLADGKVHRVAVSVNGNFVKAYVDGQRMISDPEGAERPIARLGLELSSYKDTRQDDLMFTNFRIAEATEQASAP